MQTNYFQQLYNNQGFRRLIYSRIGGYTDKELKTDIMGDVYTYILEHINPDEYPTYDDYARICNRVVCNQLAHGKIGNWYRQQMGWQNNNRKEIRLIDDERN